MTLSEAKASVLYEAGREKRITLRNLIIVGVLVLIGIFLGVKYLLPILSQQVTNVPTYVKFILPLALLLTIGYPLVRVWKIFKRREQVEEAFSLIAKGEECRITSETDDYLTVIPFWQALSYQYGSYLLPWGDDQEQELLAPCSLPCRFG